MKSLTYKEAQDMEQAKGFADWRSVEVGGAVPPAPGDTGIFLPGAPQWVALRTTAQREDQAEHWLCRRGVYAFHPVLMRKVRAKGTVREYARRYLPGYVFARFPGEPMAHRVVDCAFITGALCNSAGSWGRLDPTDLQALHAMRRIDIASSEALKAERIRRRAAGAVKPGDRALFRAGPLAGEVCEVAEITADGGALVRLGLFGGTTMQVASASSMVPLKTVR